MSNSSATFAGSITTTSTTGIIVDTTGNALLELDGASNSTEAIIFRHSGTEVSRISHSNSSNLVFSTGSSTATALTLDTSQDATFAGNIISDFNKTIALNYAAGTFGDYYKGMSGVDFGSGLARGLHLFNFDNDTNLGINFWVGTNASKTFAGRIDSNGKFGLGIDQPEEKLHIQGSANGNVKALIENTNTGTNAYATLGFQSDQDHTVQPALFLNGANNTNYAGANSLNMYQHGNFSLGFVTNNLLRMTVTGDGKVNVGNITGTFKFNVAGGIYASGASQIATDGYDALRVSGAGSTSGPTMEIKTSGTTSGASSLDIYQVNTIYGPSAIRFFYGSTAGIAVGSIRANTNSTTYNTSSDYRLKENITDLSNALERVDNLEPKRFNFKNTPDEVVDGFLAHEAQEVVPQAVSGEKDAEIDGKPSYQGIDHSMIVPLLTAAIKELKAQNEELLARIEKLENN